jgi:hypothetical protein
MPYVVNPDLGHVSLFQQLAEGPAPKNTCCKHHANSADDSRPLAREFYFQ